MHKFFLWAATAGIACVYCDMAAAKTTFLPDWQNAGLDFKGDGESDLNRDEKLCMEQNSQFKYYTSAQCPKYYALDETCDIDVHYLDCNPVRWCLENGYATQSCPADKHLYNQCPNNYPYYSKCVCNSEFRYTSSNCSGQYYVAGRSCTDDGSSTQKYTQCLCSPKSSETGCSCTTSCSDGCGGTRTCCTACPPPPSPPSTSSSGGGGGGGGSSSSGGGSSGSGSSGSGSSGNNPWVRYYKVKGNKNWYCADKNAMYAVWGCNPSDGRYCITKDGEYMPNCEVELGCYNKDTGEYKYKETKPYGAMWNGGKTFDSKAACDASGFDCIADDSYTGAWTHTTNTPCNSDGTTESFW